MYIADVGVVVAATLNNTSMLLLPASAMGKLNLSKTHIALEMIDSGSEYSFKSVHNFRVGCV